MANQPIETLPNACTSTVDVVVSDFGVLPNGKATPEQNAYGAIAMRDHMLAIQQAAGPDSAAPHFDIHWPPGLYQMDHPTLAPSVWSFGPLRYTVHAYGARLQNLKSGGASGTGGRQPMAGNLPFFFRRNRYDFTGLWSEGYDIDTVEAGSLVVVLKDQADAIHFSVGGRALVYGFETQGNSAPPNCRYFEWLTIAAIDGAAVTFNEPLQYRYDDKWPLTTNATASPSGPGKIISLDSVYSVDGSEDFFYPIYQHVKGLEVIPNPNQNPLGYDSIQLPGEYLYHTDVKHQNMTPTVNKYTVCDRCQFFQKIEGDKLVDYVLLNDCYYRAPITEFTGAKTLIVRGGTMNIGDWAEPAKAHQSRGGTILVENCSVYGYGQATPSTVMFTNSGGFPQRRATFTNNKFYVRSAQNPAAVYSQNVNPQITITGVGLGNELLLTETQGNANLWRQFELGRPIYNRETGDSGLITAMDADGANLRIAGDWSVTPVIGQVWQQHLVGTVEDSGNVAVPRATGRLRVQALQWHSNESEMKRVQISSDEIDFDAPAQLANENDVWGYVKKMEIDVIAASDSGTLNLNIRKSDLSFYGAKGIDLTQAGKRMIDENGVSGARGADSLNVLGLGSWAREFNHSIAGTPNRVSVQLYVEIAGPM